MQETKVGFGVEHSVPAKVKSRLVEIDGTENLDAVALACDWDQRLVPDTRPRLMKR